MPRLQTVRFSTIRVEQEHLALLFQSNTLHTLILFQCSLRSIAYLPPSRIAHLTMALMDDWIYMEPLLGHCSASLETLDFVGQLRRSPRSTKLPHFPRLRKLKFVVTSGPTSHLDTLTSLAPQLEHLEVWGRGPVSGLSALPVGLQYISINQWLIEHGDFGAHPFVHFPHLHITYYNHVADDDHRGLAIPIIQRLFPNLTSLEVDIHYYSRNFVLLLARALPKVTRLQLNMSGVPWSLKYNYDTSRYITETLESPLASIHVNVTLLYGQKHRVELYKDWVTQTVFSLGGPHLQEIEVAFSMLGTSIPVIWWCWKRVKEEWFFKQY